MNVSKQTIFAVSMAVFLFSIFAVAQAAIEYDQNVTPDVIYGSGNANGHFTTDRNSGVEVGLRGKIPYNGNIQSNGDGTYSYSLADTDHDNDPSTAKRWNFDFTVNTNFDGSSGLNLDQFSYELGLDTDPGLGTNYTVSDPINAAWASLYGHSFGDNSTANGAGIEPPFWDYSSALANYNVLQQSWGYRMDVTGVSGYDPDIPGTYNVYFQVSDGNGVVARSEIQVLIGGAPPAFVPDAPAVTPDLVQADDSGTFDYDDVTNENMPSFDVLCSDAAHLVTLYSDQPVANTPVGTHQCATAATEQADVSVLLLNGVHNISYSETNVVGESAQSASLAVHIDTVAPIVPVIDAIGDNHSAITGTAEADAAVNLSGATCTNAPLVADANGDWSCDLAAPLNELEVVSATATDLAGNTSLPGSTIVQHVNLAPSFSVTCTLDATDVTGVNNSLVFFPAYAFGFSVGLGESGQTYLMTVAPAAGGDPDGLITSMSINNNGDLTLDIDTTKSSVATVELTMQDDGGTALGGVDTTTVQFNVHHYADLYLDPNYSHLSPTDIMYKNTFDVCRY